MIFYCSETSLRASFHSASGRWDLKNSKANSLCLYAFSFLVVFIFLWNIKILQSKNNQGSCIIFTGSCLSEYLHCRNHYCSAVQYSAVQLYFTNKTGWAPQLLCWLTERKLLRKCENSGFLFYFKVIVRNFSKKADLAFIIVSLLVKTLRKEAIR